MAESGSVESAQIISVAGSLLLLATCSTLGVRLILLARGRAVAPERWMGAGLILVSAMAFPWILASKIGQGLVGEVRWVPLLIGLAGLAAGSTALAEFTRRVFRPRDGAGTAAVGAIAAAALSASAAVVFALLAADRATSSSDALSGVALTLRFPLIAVWAWTGTEALTEWIRARRRIALGLTSPLTVNRFFLWGLFGVVEFGFSVAGLLLQIAGRTPMNDPVAMACSAGAGLVGSALVALALCPPKAYERWVADSAG